MHACEQYEGVSVYRHGEMVKEQYDSLLKALEAGDCERAPAWLVMEKELVLPRLIPKGLVAEYLLLHDCGKAFCKEVDSSGKVHFPQHALMSSDVYGKAFYVEGKDIVQSLISKDMIMHQISAEELIAFAKEYESATLLLSSLAEIAANAQMFGGRESVNYKIKLKHLERRGKALIKLWKKTSS